MCRNPVNRFLRSLLLSAKFGGLYLQKMATHWCLFALNDICFSVSPADRNLNSNFTVSYSLYSRQFD